MKDSGVEWIGEIPEDWEVSKFKRHSKSAMGNTILKIDLLEIQTENSVPVYSATQEDVIFGYVNQDKVTTLLSKNDLVIPARGNSIGFTKLVPFNKATCTQTTIFSRLFNIDKEFVYYCSRALKDFWFEFDRTAIPQITVQQIENNPMPICSPDEQGRIARCLNKKSVHLNSIKENINREIDTLEAYKKSVITEAVTKGLDKNAEMKDSGIEWIGDIPKHWEVVRIKDKGSSRNGLTYSPSDICGEQEGTLVLRSSNIQNGKIVLENTVYVDKSVPNSLKTNIGDILICSRNGSRELIGKNAIIDIENASFGAFMMIYRTKNYRLMYYILNSSVFSYYLGTFFTSTINQLTNSNFENMKIVWCPDEKEQEQLVSYLDKKTQAIDEIIDIKQNQLSLLDEYKKSLIYEYVTGKREV